MRSWATLLGLAVTVATAAGCERLGGGLDIVNETDQTLYLFDSTIRPDGDAWRFEISECSTLDLVLVDKDGVEFVELTEEWCPGQTRTVVGKGEGTLEDS